MTQRDAADLKDEIARVLFENTTGLITATNHAALAVDFVDSFELKSPAPSPAFTSFLIVGQDTAVDPGTELSGSQTFRWTLMQSGSASGTITIKQGASDLSTTIPLAGGADTVLTINTVTLAAGVSETFEIDVTGASPRSFVVRARTLDEYVYFGSQTSSDFSTFDFQNESRTPLEIPAQTITVPTFTGNEFIGICQPTTTPDIQGLRIDSVEQIKAFPVQRSVFTVNAVPYDAWVTRRAMIGDEVSGDSIRILR